MSESSELAYDLRLKSSLAKEEEVDVKSWLELLGCAAMKMDCRKRNAMSVEA